MSRRTLIPVVVLALLSLVVLKSCTEQPASVTYGVPVSEASSPDRSYVLKLNDAVFMVGGKATPAQFYQNAFGPGLDGASLGGNPKIRNEVRYSLKDIAEGDYCLGVSMMAGWPAYFAMEEGVNGCAFLYVNDTRVVWTGAGEPLRPQNAAEKNMYQDQLRVDQPLHLKPTDVLRVMFDQPGGAVTVGPIHLATPKSVGLPPRMSEFPRSFWLYAEMAEPVRSLKTIAQSCTLTNPGVLARTFNLRVQVRDYLMAPCIPDSVESVTIQPGETITRTYMFTPSHTARDRFTLIADAPDVFPPVRRVKYFMPEAIDGQRPAVSLNGTDWEFCYMRGCDPDMAKLPAAAAVQPPPGGQPAQQGLALAKADQWQKVTVPKLQLTHPILRKEGDKEITDEFHLGWYRKTFTAPYVKGERYILKFGQLWTEAWFYLNGKQVGHQLHGSMPFEVDITDGYKPGQSNELLIAVRDWLSYSPKNQERLRKGEPLAARQDLVDLVEYPCYENIGIGSNVWLEARPAVSVDDVTIVTSVREKKLKLKYRLINKTDRARASKVSPVVLDEGKRIEMFEPRQVDIPANQTVEVSFEAAWKTPKFWWTDDPHLYVLQTQVSPAEGNKQFENLDDVHYERFGFREIWIEGGLFVMNGVKVKLKGCYGGSVMNRSSDDWHPEKRLEEMWDYQMTAAHDTSMDLGRSHLSRLKCEPVDIADETGATVKVEGEFHQIAFTDDEAFWKAGLKRNVEMVDTYKNHPSVIHWGAGNENMWGWIYLGEKSRSLASHWQYEIAKAMRDSDPMHRPVDWEADGDLFGKWQQHSLHYPREIGEYPNLPNSAWIGPRDGKTVAMDYKFGPIILGQKPISLGESYWLSPQRPYGSSVINGDDAYLGGSHQWRGWAEAIYFFVNGFRDAEFAYTDVLMFMPPFFKPQIVVLKEETCSFYGDRSITRNFNVHSDLHTPAKLVLQWSLTPQGGGKAFDSGRRAMTLDPAEVYRSSMNVSLPSVAQKTDALWKVELLSVQTVGTGLFPKTQEHSVCLEQRIWSIYPKSSPQAPQGLELSVYDPAGDTAKALKKLGVNFTKLTDLNKPLGKAMIIGQNSLSSNSSGVWREAVSNFVKNGGKVVILRQKEAPDFLPITMRLATGKKTTVAFARAGDHPVLRGMVDADLRWWAGDHNVADGNYQKPNGGRWLPLVDAGTGDGMTESPLAEVYDGKGSYLLCQMQVFEKLESAPAAGRMLQNMLDYLAAPAPFRTAGRTAVLAAETSPLWKALSESRLELANLTGHVGDLAPDRFSVAIVDVATALDDPTAAALRAFAEGGGKVLLHRGTPDKQALLEKLLGVGLRFFPVDQEPQDIRNHVIRMNNVGLLAGISNHELWWISLKYLEIQRHEGNWSSGYEGGCPKEEQIADYFCWPADDAGERAVRLTRPSAMIQATAGKGLIVLNQLRFDQTVSEVAPLAQRMRNLLLTNLGCDLRGDTDVAQARLRRLAQYQFKEIDLSAHVNHTLRDDKANGLVGWTNQGENDMRELPVGKQTFAGVPFVICSPKSAVVLYSTAANMTEPKEVKGIAVGQKADALFFLHAMAWGGKEPFKYMVHYEDGSTQDIQILTNKQVCDWWDPSDRANQNMGQYGGFVAWKGQNPMTRSMSREGVVLPGYEWVNPHPEKVIRDIDFLTVPENGLQSVPVLVAITAATMQSDEGIVTDVMNTRGIKVKMGEQVKEFYYIGLAGIEDSHPYCAKAVEAHRTMMVGKKVRMVYDVVRRNSKGQTMAYVYLGDDVLAGALINGKVLGDGLSRLGDFEGNERMRMLLTNMGEPAKWKKVGMWAEEGK